MIYKYFYFTETGDLFTEKVVKEMIKIVKNEARNPEIREFALSLVARCKEKDEKCEIFSIANFIQSHMRYIRDIRGVETISTPSYHINKIKKYGFSQGDCDDFALLTATLLFSIGYKVSFITTAEKSKYYEHIFCKVYDSNNNFYYLDLTRKNLPVGTTKRFVKKYKEWLIK